MKNPIVRSILAVLAGFLFVAIFSTLTDFILKSAGVLPEDNLYVAAWLILVVLFYRFLYQVIGCYLVARLAPHKPMKHALITGAIGLVLASAAAIATAPLHLGPLWYAWGIAVLSLPSAWLGGRLYLVHKGAHERAHRS